MSTPTIPQVRAWRPGQLSTAASGLQTAKDSVDTEVEEIRSTMDDLQSTWSGDAAAAGDERASASRRTGVRLVEALETARAALATGSTDLATAKRNVLDKIESAQGRGFQVSDDGTVTPPTLPPVMTAPGQAGDALAARDAEQERLNTEAQEIADDIGRALVSAGEADAGVASALSGVEFPQSLESGVAAYLDRLLEGGDPVAALGSSAAGAVALAQSLKSLGSAGMKGKALADFLRFSSRPITDYATFVNNMNRADDAWRVFQRGKPNGGIARFVMGSRAARLAGRAFLPLTVLTGGIDAITGGGYDGARGWATRGFGAAGAVGAGAILASSAGLVALGPVGLGIAGAAVLGYGLWSAGNYIYDNWDDISGWVGDRWDDAGAALSSARDWTGDRLADAGAAVSDATDWAGDRLSDAADTAKDLGKSALNTVSFGLFG